LVYHTLKRMEQALGSGDGALNTSIAEAKGAAIISTPCLFRKLSQSRTIRSA